MLGALTAPATGAGLWLREQPELKLNITTGNTYTAAIAIEGAEKAMELVQLKNPKMAIVGAAGVIGEAIAKHFNGKGFDLILVEREMERFERLKPFLSGDRYILTDKISDIVNADIIITATSHPEALIIPEYLKKNAIVVDVAEPSDVVSDIEERRPDVISIDGGRVKWEKVNVKFNLGLVRNVGFACMTEGMMQALENDRHDYIGSVDMEHLKETVEWGKKWDFPIADFTCFNRVIPLEKFNKILNNK
jgi:predicted amino acid dehydrogenase